ncbi:hypothetical protein CC86DRAFT_40351 [Ophiobolus disseminans]|uniref:Uncharacterized protein n=1 Tax=Ophiobolus disseminans TaxID=1469910 RepID=A0A6A6ZW06_9PLEO|nr:hypothetical protein CC86DRAFT_40351 [Ophiobolus disseminans]
MRISHLTVRFLLPGRTPWRQCGYAAYRTILYIACLPQKGLERPQFGFKAEGNEAHWGALCRCYCASWRWGGANWDENRGKRWLRLTGAFGTADQPRRLSFINLIGTQGPELWIPEVLYVPYMIRGTWRTSPKRSIDAMPNIGWSCSSSCRY